MAPIDLYDTSIALFIRGQNTLLEILKKASAAANAESLADARLIEDMRPLTFQVQAVSNTSKKAVERLTGETLEAWEDNEKTLPELIARVEKTLALLNSVDRKKLDGAEDKIVEMGLGPGRNVQVPASGYVFGYGLPNFFFHLNTAYGILRAQGLEIGKKDYLGPFLAPYVTPM